MRPTQARTVLVAFLAVVAGLALVAGETRLAVAIGILAGLAAILVLGVRRVVDRPRADAYAQAGGGLGLAPADALAPEMLALPHPLIGRPGRFREVTHVVAGDWHGMPVVGFEFTEALGTHEVVGTDHGRSLCALLPAPGRADVAIAPTSHGAAPETLGDEPAAIEAATSPDLRDWLATIDPAIGLQVAGGRLLVYRPRAQPWVLPELLETGAAFLERVPESAP